MDFRRCKVSKVNSGPGTSWLLFLYHFFFIRCVRRGRFNESVRTESKCPSSCENRLSCSACLGESGRCVWCEETQVSEIKAFNLQSKTSNKS
jgi:hypothetical protein